MTITGLRDVELGIAASVDRSKRHADSGCRTPAMCCFAAISGEALLIALDTAGFGGLDRIGVQQRLHRAFARVAGHRTYREEARSSVRFSFGRNNTETEIDLCAKRGATVGRIENRKETKAQLAITNAPIAVAMSGGVDSSVVAGTAPA